MKEINSYEELVKNLEDTTRAFLLLYKQGSDNSECAYNNVKELSESGTNKNVSVFSADVSKVRDIHSRYSITTAPSLLIFENSQYQKAIKGCQGKKYYKGLFEDNVFVSQSEGKSQKTVIVYSTPTCPHCNSLKSFLRKNHVPFRDIDVSKNQQEAQKMVQRSGQQGVPQANISGQMVVGFNKKRIKELLDL